MVRVCVLFAAGTNCDEEARVAFELAGAEAENVHVNRLKAKPALLHDFHVLMLPGGFSYGDYISSGRILANEIRHNLGPAIEKFHADGKLILGVCNGFQVLVKSGLLPGFDRLFEPQSVTLDWNDSGKFEDRWVRLAPGGADCVFTRGLDKQVFLPVAHAEGKFICRDRPTLERLKKNGQVVFRYARADGDDPGYPEDPNGSVDHIAGICDPSGRIMGMMPHPERFTRREHHPHWHRERLTKPDGISIFSNAVQYAKEDLAA